MKVTILFFSPSGNTARVADLLRQKLELQDITVKLVNITGEPDIFKSRDFERYLNKTVAEHDVLCIGGPVYAHHLQYHLLDPYQSTAKSGEWMG